MDPFELRQRNIVHEGDVMPAYYGQVNTSCALDRCLKTVHDRMDWDHKYPVREIGNGKVRAVGMGMAMQGSGIDHVDVGSATLKLFLVFFGTTRAWGWDLSGETASVIVFVLWGTAEMSDLVRGALISIPKHQYESSEALGLTKAQTYWYIIIPQTVRRLIPLSINLITRMIKTTSLVLMIGVVEVLKVAQQIIEANRMASPNAAFGIYLVVFLLYFLACWPISLLASYLEKKWR